MRKKEEETEPTGIVNLSTIEPITFLTSGIKEIDKLTGGFPRGRITILYGLAGVGKTSLMIKCLAKISKEHRVLFCDVENALNIECVKELGADVNKIDYSNLAVLEEVTELIRQSISKYDVII